MSNYEIRIDKCDWYGGDYGYGINPVQDAVLMQFKNDTEALAWAYDYVSKNSVLTAKGRKIPKTLYSLSFKSDSLITDEGDAVTYHVQHIFEYQEWYVFTRFKHEPIVKAYRLHRDGTIGRWNGLY